MEGVRATSGTCGTCGCDGGGGRSPDPGRVRIMRVDYERNELFDEAGRGYYELPGGLWAGFGPAREGASGTGEAVRTRGASTSCPLLFSRAGGG